MKMKTLVGLLALVAVGVVFWSFSADTLSDSNKTAAAVGSPAPDFTLEDQTGKSVHLADFKGKVVVLEWVNPDCPIVQRHYQAKTMVRLYGKYKSQGVVWLGVNTTHYMDKEANAKWISQHRLAYPILSDRSGEIGKAYGAKTTPHMYIIDKSGTLVFAGGIDDDPRGNKTEGVTNYVEKALDEVLAGKPVSVTQPRPYGCSVKYAK